MVLLGYSKLCSFNSFIYCLFQSQLFGSRGACSIWAQHVWLPLRFPILFSFFPLPLFSWYSFIFCHFLLFCIFSLPFSSNVFSWLPFFLLFLFSFCYFAHLPIFFSVCLFPFSSFFYIFFSLFSFISYFIFPIFFFPLFSLYSFFFSFSSLSCPFFLVLIFLQTFVIHPIWAFFSFTFLFFLSVFYVYL